ncbi:phage major capsid protein, partial [Mesorhizobium sp. M1A.F.Ca.ET.072.01.1.1]
MSLKDLNEKRERLVAQAREALDEIKKNTDDARAAELDKRHDDIMAEFDRVEAT